MSILPRLLFAFIMFSLCSVSHAQVPAIRWQKTLGGSGADYAYFVQQTTDTGYIVTGSSNSADRDLTGNHGDYDVWVVKLSDTGAIQWQRSLGGSNTDVSTCVRQTIDSGYIIAGSTRSPDGDVTLNKGGSDFWIIKLSPSGVVQWQRSYGGSGDDNAYSIQQTSDSGFIVAGSSRSADGDVTGHHGAADFWVIKLSPSGTLQWQKTLGGTADDIAASAQQTADNGYIIAGDTHSGDGDVTGPHGGEDYWVVKLSSTGTLQWQRTLGGSGSEYAQSVIQTADNGYIVAGGSNSTDMDITGNKGMGDYWVVKLSSSGAPLWQKSFGGTADDAAYCIQPTTEGGFVVAGWAASANGDVTGYHGSADFWVMKMSATGSIEWQKAMGSLGNDVAWCIQPSMDSGYILAGYTFSFGGDVTGFRGGPCDYWIVKLNMVDLASVPVREAHPGSVSPNPTTGAIYVSGAGITKVSVYDMQGRLLKETGTGSISIAGLPSGMYFLKATDETGQTVLHQKIIKE